MSRSQNEETGLSQSNRTFIVSVFTIALLLLGTVEPYGMVIRIAYLILLPVALWYGLRYFGSRWRMGELENDRLNRAIAGIIAGVLFVQAFSYWTASHHMECTQEVQTRDGIECVGDYVTAKGPDRSKAFTVAFFGGLAVWYAITKRSSDEN